MTYEWHSVGFKPEAMNEIVDGFGDELVPIKFISKQNVAIDPFATG